MNRRRGFKSEREDSNESPNGDHSNHGIEQKKSRLEDNADNVPSRVVHIRNVPASATEEDIAALAVPFGCITNMIYARRNNQALLEMESSGVATVMVGFYNARPPAVHGRTCIVQFSRHIRLDTRNENSSVGRAIDNANLMARRERKSIDTHDGGRSSFPPGGEIRCVLHVMLENRTNEAINHLLLYKVFSQFGRVLRIIMFTKVKIEHALIEYDTPSAAMSGRNALDNKALLGGRYPIRIEFSKMPQLEVRTENDKCRDFERSPLTEVEYYAINALSMITDLVVDTMPSGQQNYMPSGSNFHGSQQSGGAASLGTSINNLPGRGGDNADSSNNALSSLAAMMSLSRMGSNSGGPMCQDNWMGNPNNGGMLGNSGANLFGMNSLADLSQRLGANNMLGNNVRSSRESPVLIVSNLNENRVEPDSLFTLFGVYGDVVRVKILFNKKDTALIQFTDSQQALTAKENLNNVVLWDQEMKVNVSRHMSIQMPREETDVGLTKDYSSSNLHRFKNPMSKNHKNIFPPGPVLHLSNIPLEFNEDEITDLFQSRGYDVVNFKFLQKDASKKKMALVQLPSVDDAVTALIDLHNFELGPTSHLRVSFSSRIQQKH